MAAPGCTTRTTTFRAPCGRSSAWTPPTRAGRSTSPPPTTSTWQAELALDLGGPIKKDRLWGYVGYNQQKTERQRTVVFTSNPAAGPQTFKSVPTDQILNSNLVGQVSKSLRAKFSMTNQWARDGFGVPSINTDGTSYDNPTLFPPPNRLNRFSNSFAGIVDWVANNNTYVNVTATYLRYGGASVGVFSDKLRHLFQRSNFQYPEIPADLQHVSGYRTTRRARASSATPGAGSTSMLTCRSASPSRGRTR